MNAQLRPATLTDNELRATIYFGVGVASEGSLRGRNVAYDLAFAGYIHREGDTARGQPREAGVYREGQLEPVYNSGYSVGTLQSDFGQQRNDANRNADQLLNAYQEWARQPGQRPNLALSPAEYDQASDALRRQGNEIRGNRQTVTDNGYDVPAGVKTRLNEFLRSDAGVTFVHNQDVRQVNHLLREGGAVRELEDTALYRNATADDQIRMATVISNLENQDGRRNWPGISDGDGPEQGLGQQGAPQRHAALMLDNPMHQNHGMFAAALRAVNDRDAEMGRQPDDVSRQLAGGLVEKARERGLEIIGAARFTPDGTKVGMTDTADLSAPWAKTAVGEVGQLAGQTLAQSSENVSAINQEQSLQQSLQQPMQTQSMEGPEDPAPRGPRMV